MSVEFADLAASRPGLSAVRPSLIQKVAEQGADLEGVIKLWFGEPDRVTPKFIRDAATAALDDGHTFYVSNFGVLPLRQALSDYNARLGRDIEVERIFVASSGVNAIQLACDALLSPGDRVVLPGPYWPNLSGIPAVRGAEVVSPDLTLDGDVWRLDMDVLLDAITPETRMVMLNAPGNPSGWMLTRAEQETILAHCRRLGVWILADDVYERVVFSGDCAPSFLDIATPEDRVVSINSFSKNWAMTGWRLGWIVAPPTLLPTLAMLGEYSISCVAPFIQHAGVVALRDGEAFLAEMRARYRANRDLVVERLRAIPRLQVPRPEGAMYAFFRVEGCDDSFALALDLLRKERVGLAPGVAFGPRGEGCLRLCFAAEANVLSEACDRIGAYLSRQG